MPSLPRKLAEAKSYAERLCTYHTVDAPTDADAATALSSPAETEGVTWQSEAINHVLTEAGGYPYFLQQYGQDTWNNATGTPIDLDDARLGVATGQLALDTGFFRVRWDRATSAEKDYLKAMAQDGDRGSASGEVAARLRKKTTALGPVRANLINKGLIYSPDLGVIAYTVPTMAAFVKRQDT